MRTTLVIVALLAATAAAAPAKPAANAVYILMSKGASFDPAKDGKLTLTGVSSSLAGVAKDGDNQLASRVATADAFGKDAIPIFASGADIIVEGKTAGGDKRILLNVTNPKFTAATNELTFSPASVVKTAALSGLVDAAPAVTPINKTVDGKTAAKMDDVVVFVDAYAPHMKAAIARQKAKAGGNATAAAAAPAPSMAAMAPADAVDAAPASKPGPKPPKPPPKPAATPATRRLAQYGCTSGYCMYVNKAGACVQAPSSCDGVPGETGESWGCPQCQYFQMDDFLGHCSNAPNC